MDNESKAAVIAKVDLQKVKFSKGIKLGMDLSNEIDIWAKMEFRSREQIKKLRRNGTLDGHEILKDLNSLIYAVRTKLE